MAQQAQAAMTPGQQNALARAAILAQAIEMTQVVDQKTLAGVIPGQVVNLQPRNVGLIKRFVLEITGDVTQSAAEVQTLTHFGPANILSAVTFNDLNNSTRINTAGWHLHLLATARHQSAFGAAFTNDSPTGIGSNFQVNRAPSPVTTVQSFRFFYEIPLSYSDFDLRGAIFANVVNATQNLQVPSWAFILPLKNKGRERAAILSPAPVRNVSA